MNGRTPSSFLDLLEDRLLLSGSLSALQVPSASAAGGVGVVYGSGLTATSFSLAVNLAVPPLGAATATGSLSVGQSRFYKFTAQSTGSFTMDLAATGGGLDPLLRIYNAQGVCTYSNDNASSSTRNSRVQMSAQSGQLFCVEAVASGRTSGGYLLTLTASPSDDYGNTLQAAQAVTLSQAGAASLTGRVNYNGDVDVFALTAKASGTMSVALRPMGADANFAPRVYAYDAGGALLGQGGSAVGQPASLQLTVVSGRTYYVLAAGLASGTGAYQVDISTAIAAPAPGTTTTAEVRTTGGATQLFVLGTNNADTVTVSRSSGIWSVRTVSGTLTFSQTIAGIVMYGFGGADTLRADWTVNVPTWIYGGDGNDQIFDAGSAAGTLSGGAGDDLLVTVGGGADQLNGDDGLDSLWYDATDTASGVAAAEVSNRTTHRIAQFYQPYTTNSASASYVSLQIAGQNLADPTLASYAKSTANFASTPLFVDGPQYDDIRQGALGDCYYLAALAGIADTDPDIIRQMIAPLGDGTFAVRYYNGSAEVYVRLDADLPVISGRSLAYAGLGPDGELWVPLAEKAYAYYRYGQNSYASIEGGWMDTVNRQVTGRSSSFYMTSSGTAQQLYDYIAANLSAGHAVTLGSYSNAASPVVGGHAYTVKSVQSGPGGYTITVFNPWGVDGRAWDSNPNDGLLTLSLNTVFQNYVAAVVSLA